MMNFVKVSKLPKRKENMYSSQRQLIENDTIDVGNMLDSDCPKNQFILNTYISSEVLHENQSNVVENGKENVKNNISQSNNNSSNLQEMNVSTKEKRQSMLRNFDISDNKFHKECIEHLEMSVSSCNSSITMQSNASQHTDTTSKSSSSIHKNHISESHSSHQSKLKYPENKICYTKDNKNLDGEKKITSKRKKKVDHKIEEIELNNLGTEEIAVSTNANKTNYCFIGVHILGTEILQNHLYLCFPCVKLHIIDCKSGKYLTNHNMVELKTKTYDLHQNSSIVPYWDEILLFDDLLTKNLALVEEILIIFEVINDHQSSGEILVDKGMTIAWAFIKPISLGGHNYTNRKLKLQLYKPNNTMNNSQNYSVYEWWKNKPWKVYPSILNVVIKSLHETETQDIVHSIKLSLFQNNHEKNACKYPPSQSIIHRKGDINLTQRSKGQNCMVPNKIVKCISIEKCSNIIKFSHCGNYLACGVLKDSKQIILIYTVPQFLEKIKLCSHKNIIYDICWSVTNRLITASADSTICLWDITREKKYLLQRIFHPAFVYSSKFCPINENIVVTGCYDKVVRVWMSTENADKIDYSLHQELTSHGGFVNAICFVSGSDMFYSGDSVGIIIKWTLDQGLWIKMLIIDAPQFKHKIINDLQIFPDNHRILVVIRNSPSWTFDIATSTAFICYKDGVDSRYQVRGVISGCGTLLFIGNNVWSASTGQLLAIYNPSAYDHHDIMTVDYHPHYFLMAMGCGLNGSPILCCEYQEGLTTDNELKLGLEIISPNFQYPELTKNSIICPSTPKRTAAAMLKVNPRYHFTDIANSARNLKADKDSKLWSLINKMDDAILISGRRNKGEINFENELPSDNIDSKSSTGSGVNRTFMVDLTEFHRKMNLHEILPSESLNFQSNHSSDKDTYTVEKEILIKSAIKDLHANNDSSSNLSNAESLEDDMITYSIS